MFAQKLWLFWTASPLVRKFTQLPLLTPAYPSPSVWKPPYKIRYIHNCSSFVAGISNIFGMLGFYTPFVYLPNLVRAVKKTFLHVNQ